MEETWLPKKHEEAQRNTGLINKAQGPGRDIMVTAGSQDCHMFWGEKANDNIWRKSKDKLGRKPCDCSLIKEEIVMITAL